MSSFSRLGRKSLIEISRGNVSLLSSRGFTTCRNIVLSADLTKCSGILSRPVCLSRRGFQTKSSSRAQDVLSANTTTTESDQRISFHDFENQKLLHPKLAATLSKDLKYENMTPIQAATFKELVGNRIDCLAQAKTGTGKTVAFLLPGLQTLITRDRKPGKQISLLVISPTRELALQIEKEAQSLLHRFPSYTVQNAIGGTNKEKATKKILQKCDILIATPGRLLDHLSDPVFSERFEALDTLVLDEADRLLDMGFKKDLEKIVSHLPDKTATNRQGMLFSATLSPAVDAAARLVLGPNYKFITTIPIGEKLTHEKVVQNLITVPVFADIAPALVSNIKSTIQRRGFESYKAIVFAPTAGLSDFYYRILQEIPDIPQASVLHSRLSQAKRSRTINEFRTAKCGILVATDVVARGIDIPAVSDVIQAGVPQNKEAYIHRLGRTARAGADGEGAFIISEAEKFFPSKILADIKFVEQEADLRAKEDVLQITTALGEDVHKKIYQAWIGYYKNHVKGMGYTAHSLIDEANKFATEGLGVSEIPTLSRDVVARMGFRGMPGLKVAPKKARPVRQEDS